MKHLFIDSDLRHWKIAEHKTDEVKYIFHTNRAGEGVWKHNCWTGEEWQITGTCQFQATSKSAIRRWMRDYYNIIESWDELEDWAL